MTIPDLSIHIAAGITSGRLLISRTSSRVFEIERRPSAAIRRKWPASPICRAVRNGIRRSDDARGSITPAHLPPRKKEMRSTGASSASASPTEEAMGSIV
jgi:hypothetical protein